MGEATASRYRRGRVVACRGGDEIHVEERDVPAPGQGEALLSLRAVGLCGTDLFKLATDSAKPGSVLGHELVGTVVDLGPGVEDFQRGDRVAVSHHVPCGHCPRCHAGNETLCGTFRENLMHPGGFSDLILIRERAVRHAAIRLPDALTDDIAVWIEPAACVLRSVERGGLTGSGRRGLAVVLGAGSMGALHLLMLKALHPDINVVMVDPDERRRSLAARLGAERTVTPEQAPRAVHEMHRDGAGTVFDTVGGARALDSAIALSREGGTIVLFAHAPAGEQARFDINSLFKFERRIIGSYSGTPSEQQRVFELMCDERLDPSPLISHRMDLSDFNAALGLVKRREAMKVVFTGRVPGP